MYSLQCLNEFQWNFASALEGYQKVKVIKLNIYNNNN